MRYFQPISVSTFYGEKREVTYDGPPDECPLCHSKIDASLVAALLREHPEEIDKALQIVFQCPLTDCQSVFISHYWHGERAVESGVFHLQFSEPQAPREHIFSAEISNLSPNFVAIYNEAMATETHKLELITGMGLRKALEFLIKDFAISLKPMESESIKSSGLVTVIKDYCQGDLKIVAERAAWLGNDHTHYHRSWEDMDLKHLKELIDVAVNHIQSAILLSQYKQMMPARSRSRETLVAEQTNVVEFADHTKKDQRPS